MIKSATTEYSNVTETKYKIEKCFGLHNQKHVMKFMLQVEVQKESKW